MLKKIFICDIFGTSTSKRKRFLTCGQIGALCLNTLKYAVKMCLHYFRTTCIYYNRTFQKRFVA